jgi:hypothetical protein
MRVRRATSPPQRTLPTPSDKRFWNRLHPVQQDADRHRMNRVSKSASLADSIGTIALPMAACVALFQTLISVVRAGLWAGDLPAYLVGWRLARTPESLYDLDAQRSMAGVVLGRAGAVPACPFNYPPHLAAVGRFIPGMTYDGVLYAWLVMSGLLLVAVVWTWVTVSRYRWVVAVATLASPPVAVSLITGSILPVAAAGGIAAVAATQRVGRRWAAIGGLGWAAVATKPHLAVVLAGVCLLLATRSTIRSLGVAVPIVVGVPTLVMGPRIWLDWVSFLGQFSRSTEGDLMCRVPRSAPNLEGTLTRAGFVPPAALIWGGYLAAIALLLVWVARRRPPIGLGCAFAAAIVPLTAPHANPQDLLLCLPLLALPTTRSNRVANMWACVVSVVLLIGTDPFTVAVQLGVCLTVLAGLAHKLRRSDRLINSPSFR